VWSYSATLRLTGVSKLVVAGEPSDRDYVSDGSLRAATGAEIELAALVESRGGPGTLDLLLAGSGAGVKANFRACALVSMRAISRLEE
jgi:hypothetical protein